MYVCMYVCLHACMYEICVMYACMSEGRYGAQFHHCGRIYENILVIAFVDDGGDA